MYTILIRLYHMGGKKMSKRKNFLIGAGFGFLLGYIIMEQIDKQQMTPERALQVAKEKFQENWPINGSWIYVKPETIERNDLTYETYRGGISRNVDGENTQYGFYIDIDTGAIIDLFEIDV